MKSIHSSFAALALAAILLPAGAAMAADTYEIDPVHSMALFRIGHANVGNVWGRINGPTGKIVVDSADPSKSSVEVELKADAVDTANTKRDEHLKTADFFNAPQFPTLSFKSKSVKKDNDDEDDKKEKGKDDDDDDKDEEEYLVTGDLTILGVTKEITVEVEKTGESNTEKGAKVGFEASFKIKRSDYGMTKMLNMVGDEVKIVVAIEAGKKPEGAPPARTTPGAAGSSDAPARGR